VVGGKALSNRPLKADFDHRATGCSIKTYVPELGERERIAGRT
jgi:hypothetical protein